MGDDLDYVFILKALEEIPFGVGKKLLTSFLQGKTDHDSIEKNQLDRLENFGTMAYGDRELSAMIDRLKMNGLVERNSINGNKYWKVYELTKKGRDEIYDPTLNEKSSTNDFEQTETVITKEDRELFQALDGFLGKYNDEQKKAITCSKKNVVCIAGAGSGKTTVLTKRIEFLTKYRAVNPEKVLAITFTRKARQEMMNRLPNNKVNVETFNSFCEKMLRKHEDIVYDKSFKVTSYREKIVMVKKALDSMGLDMQDAIQTYFTTAQRKSKSKEQLANIFMNDCFFIRDYLKFKNRPLKMDSFDTVDSSHVESAELVANVCKFIEKYMEEKGLRDFADQLMDCLKLFEEKPELIPDFEHILIDEFQDVNSTQIKLIEKLDPTNLFAVGDPRQSIYGWRGSDISYILNFSDDHEDSETVSLTTNYRSTEHIVSLINESIERMGLPDLEPSIEGEKDVRLLEFDSQETEFEFVLQRVLASDVPRDEIFVLARTNRQLNELSQFMKQRGLEHIVRSDDKKKITADKDEVTLATVHSIKGMEAEMVFVIGCNGSNFPCKGSEHPVIEMVKVDEYDKEEEERRLFYVAMSRAKKSLYLTYSGNKPTHFITDKMISMIEGREANAKLKVTAETNDKVVKRLKKWRKKLSEENNVPAYVIMNDKTIIDLKQKMPLTEAELETVYGLGPTKISKYGEDILNLLHR